MLTVHLLLYTGASEPSGRGGTEDGSEEWGYAPVRPGASMFYWFYKTTHPDGDLDRPIILWLQVWLIAPKNMLQV